MVLVEAVIGIIENLAILIVELGLIGIGIIPYLIIFLAAGSFIDFLIKKKSRAKRYRTKHKVIYHNNNIKMGRSQGGSK